MFSNLFVPLYKTEISKSYEKEFDEYKIGGKIILVEYIRVTISGSTSSSDCFAGICGAIQDSIITYDLKNRGSELFAFREEDFWDWSNRGKRENIYFENNKPKIIETLDARSQPIWREVFGDYLKNHENFRRMIQFIPDTEPIKPVLENLVR